MDITFQFSNILFISQIKKDIELFKEKVGKSIVNGSVAIKLEFGKLIYEFDIAKKDDISKLYGTLTITLEFDFDLNKAVEVVGEKVSNLIGVVLLFVVLLLFVYSEIKLKYYWVNLK